MPCPDRPEAVEEAHIFEQIRIKPESRWRHEQSDHKQDQTEYGHCEEQADEAEHAHAEIPHAGPQFVGPQGEENDSENGNHGADSI
jgi:hypothetical protein